MGIITFESDGYALMGTLHLPKTTPAPVVIGCHGLVADRNSPKQKALAQACSRQGIGYLRFDHRGCGDSQGEFSQVTSLEARRSDLLDAIGFLHSTGFCNGKIGLFGSSMGGAVCLSVGSAAGARVMVTFAAPLHSRFAHAGDHPIGLSFDITNEIQGVRNIHIFHGEEDDVVPLDHARLLLERASNPKKLTIQPGGDHRMSDPAHQASFIRESVGWFAGSFFK